MSVVLRKKGKVIELRGLVGLNYNDFASVLRQALERGDGDTEFWLPEARTRLGMGGISNEGGWGVIHQSIPNTSTPISSDRITTEERIKQIEQSHARQRDPVAARKHFLEAASEASKTSQRISDAVGAISDAECLRMAEESAARAEREFPPIAVIDNVRGMMTAADWERVPPKQPATRHHRPDRNSVISVDMTPPPDADDDYYVGRW